ncbi:MAG: hypothetical protein HQL24_05660 [Candidatus Omnitrophica bacterium]|nr:hypothetical protein [Candidatus Omnitrophota bacterium]
MSTPGVDKAPMKDDFLKTMREFVLEGGQIALAFMDKRTDSLKSDQSVITEADKRISALAHAKLAPYLKQPGHVLLDEEDPKKANYLNQEFLEKTPYLWAMDPVDGTRLYANQMPLFGVSLGLLKDLKPWLGMVYFPALKELFYCDGEGSYFVQNAFLPDEKKVKIKPQDIEVTSKSLFLLSDLFFDDFSWDHESCRILITACAVTDVCWPAIGRGVGCFDQSHLWDFAGSWPIAQSAGLEFRNWKTGKVLDKVSEDSFKKVNGLWQLKDYHLLSTEKNFPVLKSKIRPLKS